MNDNDIKNILKRDDSIPAAPRKEWSNIQKKIDHSLEKKNKWIYTMGASLVACSITLFVISNNYNTSVDNSLSEQEITDFLFEDDYLDNSTEALYTWVD